jgi:hypothetical protein
MVLRLQIEKTIHRHQTIQDTCFPKTVFLQYNIVHSFDSELFFRMQLILI